MNESYRDLGVGTFYQEDDTYPQPPGYKRYRVQDFGTRKSLSPIE